MTDSREIFAAAFADRGDSHRWFLADGMQASFDYFVARYPGYEPSMYDASFFEWSREELPVETAKNP